MEFKGATIQCAMYLIGIKAKNREMGKNLTAFDLSTALAIIYGVTKEKALDEILESQEFVRANVKVAKGDKS